MSRALLLEVRHQLLGHQVDLGRIVRHRPEHEVLEPRLHQVVDARVDVVDGADHVRLLQVLVGPVGAHGLDEGRLGGGHRLGVARGVHQVDEVAVPEGELLRITAEGLRMLLEQPPVPLHPVLRARAAREPVARLDDAVHDGGRDDRHVVLARIGHARAAGDPDLRHLGRARVDGDVVEVVELAVVARVRLGEQQGHRLDDLIGPLAALLDAGAGHLVLARVPAGAHSEDVAVVGEVAEGGDLLGQQHRVAHRQHQDAGGDVHLRGQRRRVGQRAQRLEPGIAVEAGRGQQVVDHPHVDAVPLALHDGVADAAHVLRVRLLAAPRVGGDPRPELELGHEASFRVGHHPRCGRRRCQGRGARCYTRGARGRHAGDRVAREPVVKEVMAMRRRRFWSGAALALLVVLTAGAPTVPAQSASTLVVGLVAEPVALDPAQVTDLNSNRVGRRVVETLVAFADESTQIVPGLAESWTIAKDGLTYTFKLRKGVTFHDGTPLNADAVNFSIERQINPEHPANKLGKYPFAVYNLGNVKAVEAMDDSTVRFVLKEPRASFLAIMTSGAASIVSPTAAMKSGQDYAVSPVGTGPFKFVAWDRGQRVVLEKNPGYWRFPVKVDRVIYRPITEDQARLTELLTGGLDLIVGTPPDFVAQLENHPKVTLHRQVGAHVWYLGFNNGKKPFDDKRVRQALNYAVNKEAIVRDVLKGTGAVSKGPVLPGTWGDEGGLKPFPYDPARAW